MKCPKCGYNSFEFLDSCRKCNADLVPFKKGLGIAPLVFPANHTPFGQLSPMVEPEPEVSAEQTVAAPVTGEGREENFSWDTPTPEEPPPSDQPFTGFDLEYAKQAESGETPPAPDTTPEGGAVLPMDDFSFYEESIDFGEPPLAEEDGDELPGAPEPAQAPEPGEELEAEEPLELEETPEGELFGEMELKGEGEAAAEPAAAGGDLPLDDFSFYEESIDFGETPMPTEGGDESPESPELGEALELEEPLELEETPEAEEELFADLELTEPVPVGDLGGTGPEAVSGEAGNEPLSEIDLSGFEFDGGGVAEERGEQAAEEGKPAGKELPAFTDFDKEFEAIFETDDKEKEGEGNGR